MKEDGENRKKLNGNYFIGIKNIIVLFAYLSCQGIF